MAITLARKKTAILFIKKRMRRSSRSYDLADLETYEVFLSFRGKETRKDFTDHLYQRLKDAGVWVFKDDRALRVGKKIGPELDKAIKASKISIPIISPNYASSKWCLRELVHILECKKTTGQVVFPIFYKVEPSSVREQTGTFREAFHLHEKKYGSKSKVVREWRNALVEVASLSGWESSKIGNGHEARLVEVVVTNVLNELRKATLIAPKYLVGTEDHKENILKMVEAKASSDAQAIVIHGMGGVGKTTLAKVIYNHLSRSFKHCCYLPDIRERLSERQCRPEELQKQLISNIIGQQWSNEISNVDEGIKIIRGRLKHKKVLILFDDVDRTDQLNALARECSWFKSGSILIITTRNKDVLKTWEGRLDYELNGLDFSLSLQLFCKHAFHKIDECHIGEFDTIAKDIVATTGGLPLAIEVIGSMLLGKCKGHWEGVLKKLQMIPHVDVRMKLQISYDALEYRHQQIFLDIACLSIGYRMDFAFYMWDDCGFHPEEGIEELICRSLIKRGDQKQLTWLNQLWNAEEALEVLRSNQAIRCSLIKRGDQKQLTMHDQLRDLGREIVRQDAGYDLGNQSRLWNAEEALEVLRSNQGTAKIRALILSNYSFGKNKNCYLTSGQFKNLSKLRFLQLDGVYLEGDFENLLLDLRWLQWRKCVSIPANLCPSKLVVLDLSYGRITEHWEGWAQIQLVKKLRVLMLASCNCLTSTPDFSAFEKLEILNLRWCRKLKRIDPSICNLNKTLLTLDVRGCEELEELPTKMGKMEKLRELLVDRTSIRAIPISEGFMTKLEILSATFCNSLHHLPGSIEKLVNLVTLSLDGCTSLTKLPESIGKLKSLTQLKLTNSKVMELPNSIGDLDNLNELDISGTPIERLPTTIGKLRNLQLLIAESLLKLTEVCDEIGDLSGLRFLSFNGCSSLSPLPESIHNLYSLQELNLSGGKMLKSILNLPCGLKKMSILDCNSLEKLPDISLFTSLEKVCVNGCEKLTEIKGLREQKTLKIISIFDCNSLEKLLDISLFTSLEEVDVDKCEKLTEIRGLREQKTLKRIRIFSCNSLEKLPDISLFTSLEEIHVNGCEKLTEIKGIREQKTLKIISIFNCNSLEKLPDISLFTSLEEVFVEGCEKLTEIKGLREQKALQRIIISSCNSLEKLPDISRFTSLEEVFVEGCEKLTEIKGIREQKTLKIIRIFNCNSLEKLPDISLFTSLEEVHVGACEKLTEIKGIREQKALQIIIISSCNSLEILPDISLFTSLEEIYVDGYEKLT